MSMSEGREDMTAAILTSFNVQKSNYEITQKHLTDFSLRDALRWQNFTDEMTTTRERTKP